MSINQYLLFDEINQWKQGNFLINQIVLNIDL